MPGGFLPDQYRAPCAPLCVSNWAIIAIADMAGPPPVDELSVGAADGELFGDKTSVYKIARDMVKDLPTYTYGNATGKRSSSIGTLNFPSDKKKELPAHFILPMPNPFMDLSLTKPVDLGAFGHLMCFLVFWAPDVFFYQAVQGLTCPHCGSKERVQNDGYAPYVRAVPGPQVTYLILARKYACMGCPVALAKVWVCY